MRDRFKVSIILILVSLLVFTSIQDTSQSWIIGYSGTATSEIGLEAVVLARWVTGWGNGTADNITFYVEPDENSYNVTCALYEYTDYGINWAGNLINQTEEHYVIDGFEGWIVFNFTEGYEPVINDSVKYYIAAWTEAKDPGSCNYHRVAGAGVACYSHPVAYDGTFPDPLTGETNSSYTPLLYLSYTLDDIGNYTSYYISNNGDNGNNGTSIETPWKNISYLNSKLLDGTIVSGDNIYFNRSNTFSGEIDLAKGGVADDFMIIGSYGTGDRPIIENSDDSGNGACINLGYETSYTIIENLTLKDCNRGIDEGPGGVNHTDFIIRNVNGSNFTGGEAIFLWKTINFTIEGCDFVDGGICLYGDPYSRLSNGKVLNCTVDGEFNALMEDCITVHRDGSGNPAGSNFYIYNCTSWNATENGFDFVGGNEILVDNCETYGCSEYGISIGGDVRNLTIQNCYIHDILAGINLGSTNQTIIRNNTFYNTTDWDSLRFSTYDGSGHIWEGYNSNQSIYNNNFIYPNFWTDDLTERMVSIQDNYISYINIKNNIFADFSDSSNYLYQKFGTAGGDIPPNSDFNFYNNLWYQPTGTGLWYNYSEIMDVDDWQSYYPSDFVDDPEFQDEGSGNLLLNDTSPCINGGSNLTQTSGTGSNTNWVTVVNASYFMDGYDFVIGDEIFVGSDNDLVIQEINYYNNSFKINRSITWANNENVSLMFNGTAPDIGAYDIDLIQEDYSGPNWYVSNSGSNNNNGSQDFPWRTIAKVNAEIIDNNLSIGDDIYFERGDSFTGELDIRIGGNSGDRMIVGAYGTGNRPIIENPTGIDNNCCITVWFGTCDYLTIENLDLRNTTGTGDAISIGNVNHTDITISNVYAEGITGNSLIFLEKLDTFLIENCEGNACSVVLYGDEYQRTTNGRVFNCTCYNTSGDAFILHRDDSNRNTGDSFVFRNCTAWGWNENAFDLTAGNEVLVEDCEGYDGVSLAFAIGHDIENLTVQNCYIHDNNGSGIMIGDAENVIIRNNTVWNTYDGSAFYFSTTDGTGWFDEDGYAQNITIYNNNFVYPSTFTGEYTNRIVALDSAFHLDVVLKNNIFASFNTTPQPDRVYRVYDNIILPPTDNTTFYNNIWWIADGDDSGKWYNGSDVMDLSDWQLYYPTDDWDDPEFNDPDNCDLDLNNTSPCIDSGGWLTYTVGSGTNTPWVTVNDSTYFMDGYGWIDGDVVFVGDDTDLMILEVNHDNDSFKVDSSITWADSENVSFNFYNGSKIDIGRYESQYGGSSIEVCCPYPPNQSTDNSITPTNLSIRINGSNLDVYFYFNNMTGPVNSTTLFASWSDADTGYLSFDTYNWLAPGDEVTDWIWGNVRYIWYINVTNGSGWMNETYYYDTGGSRYDVDASGDVIATDASRVWSHRTGETTYNGIYDVNYGGDITATDASIVWANRT